MVTEEERELLRMQLKQELEKEESSQVAESANEGIVSELDKDLDLSGNSNEDFGLPPVVYNVPSIERFELMKLLVELEEQWKQEKPKVFLRSAAHSLASPRIRPGSRLMGSGKSPLSNQPQQQAKLSNSQSQVKASSLPSQVKASSSPSQVKASSLQQQAKTSNQSSQSKTSNSQPKTPIQTAQPRVLIHSSQQTIQKLHSKQPTKLPANTPSQVRSTKSTNRIQLLSPKPLEKHVSQTMTKQPQFSPVQKPKISLNSQFRPFEGR